MSADTTEVASVLLEKLEKYVDHELVDMVQNFNEFGPQGVTLTNYMKTLPKLYGKYSETAPYLLQSIRAIQSGMRSTSSINGKMQTAILVRKAMMYQQGLFSEAQPKKSGGLFGGLFGGDDKNKDQQKQANSFGGF